MDLESVSLQEYGPVINRVTDYCRRRGRTPDTHEIDSRGFDREDYRQEIALRAWQAVRQFQSRYGFSAPAEHRWTYKVLWDATRRLLRRKAAGDRQPIARGVPVPEVEVTFEGYYEAADALGLLRAGLQKREWDTLVRVAEAESIDLARTPDEGAKSGFYRRVRATRVKARELLADPE